MGKSNITKTLEKMTKEDRWGLVLKVLMVLRNNPSYGILSDLMLNMCSDCFLTLVELKGGGTLDIPSKDDCAMLIDAMGIYQYYQDHPEANEKEMINFLKMTPSRVKKAKPAVEEIIKAFEEEAQNV